MSKELKFHLFKGLQRPLEFMGIRGRFLMIAAMGIGGSFISFLLAQLIFSKIIAFVIMLLVAAICLISIYIKQKQGLHSKKRVKAIFIYKSIFINPLK